MATQDPPPMSAQQQQRALAVQKDILAAMGRIDRQIIALLNALEKWSDAGQEEKPEAFAPEKFALVAAGAQRLHEMTGELVETCDGYDASPPEEGSDD